MKMTTALRRIRAPHAPMAKRNAPDYEVSFERRRGDERVEELLQPGSGSGGITRAPPDRHPRPILRRLTTMAATTATRSSTEATSKSRVKISAPWLTPSRSRPKAPTSPRPVPGLRRSPVLGGEHVGKESPDARGHEETGPELAVDDGAVAPDLRLLGEHDPEQDHHRHGPDVDEDLKRGERRRVEHHEVPGDPEERPRHEQRRVHDAAAQDHPERRDQRHPGQESERYRQAASSFRLLGRSTVFGAFLAVGFFFFFTAGLGSIVGSTGRSPNCLASSRRL